MSVTAEELEIVIKANVTDAIKKLEGLKGQIQKTMSKTVEPMQKVNTQVAKTMSTTMNQTSKAMSNNSKQMEIINRQIELQKEKVKQLKKEYDKYLDYRSVKRRADKGDIGAEQTLRNTYNYKAPKNVYNQLEQAEIRLEKLKLSANNTASKLSQKLAPALEKVTTKVKKMNTNAISATKIFKRMSLSMLIGRLIRTAINEAIKGFQDLARYSSDFNNTMSKMQGQFITVRNSIAVAFEPLIKAVLPAIEWLTDRIINLFNTLSKINTILFTNNKTYTIAKKVTTDYAQSLGEVSKQQNKVLAGFDELNVLAQETGMGNQTGLPDASEMFETIELDRETPSKYDRLTQSLLDLKEAIEPFTENLFDGLKWAYEKVLVPLGRYITNGIAPIFITLLGKAIKVVNRAIEFAKPVLEWLWDNFLEPIATWTGGVILTVLESLGTIIGGLFDIISGETTWTEFWETLTGGEKFVLLLADAFLFIAGGPIGKVVGGIGLIIEAVQILVDWIKEAIEGLEEIGLIDTDYSANVGKGTARGGGGGGGTRNGKRKTISVSGGGGFRGLQLASGGVLNEPTIFMGGEYAGASTNPEIVTPQSLMYETSVKANIPVINAVEEMGDRLVGALQNIGVYAEFGYDKLKVGLDAESKRTGKKLYSM